MVIFLPGNIFTCPCIRGWTCSLSSVHKFISASVLYQDRQHIESNMGQLLIYTNIVLYTFLFSRCINFSLQDLSSVASESDSQEDFSSLPSTSTPCKRTVSEMSRGSTTCGASYSSTSVTVSLMLYI